MFVPIVQRELDDFSDVVWNNKKGRKQPKKALPNGIPPVLVYEFPEACEGDYNDYKIALNDDDFESLGNLEDLQPVFEGVVENYIPEELTAILNLIYEESGFEPLETLELEKANEAYIFLRERFKTLGIN